MSENGDLLKPVPDTSKAGWNTTVEHDANGEVSFIKSHQAKLGIDVTYGQGPDSYDQWIIEKSHGGGSVIIPYLWIDGELYVGANRQNRSATGGLVTEVPRGFALPTETPEEAAKREFREETGVIKPLAERVRALKGKPTNPDSALIRANPRKGEGDKLFGVEIERSEVYLRRGSENTEEKKTDPRKRVYKFTPKVAGKIKELNEKIKPEGIRFFHASLLSETSDGFALQGISRLATQTKK